MSRAILRWYGHVERMEENRLTRRVYEAKVEGRRDRRRPRRRWMECIRERVESKGLTMEVAGELAKERGGWRRWYRGGREEAQSEEEGRRELRVGIGKRGVRESSNLKYKQMGWQAGGNEIMRGRAHGRRHEQGREGGMEDHRENEQGNTESIRYEGNSSDLMLLKELGS